MAVYIIACDFTVPNGDYSGFYNKVRSIGPTRQDLESIWFLESTKSAQEIYNLIRPFMNAKDKIFISKVTPGDYGNVTSDFWPWLNRRITS